MDFIDIDDKSIYYRFINKHLISDNNTVLIFLHEGLGCSHQWKKFPEELCDLVKIGGLVYDRYGYGCSKQIDEPRKSDFLKQEAESFLPQLLQKLGISHCSKILFGHSDGGTIALHFAAISDNKLLGIITEAAHVFTEEITLNGLKHTLYEYQNKSLREKLFRFHKEKTDNMFYSWINIWLSEEMKSWNIEHILPSITCPVLAIQGELDNYGTTAQVESIVTKSSGKNESLIIQQCGHIPHHESRQVVIEETVRFVQTLL